MTLLLITFACRPAFFLSDVSGCRPVGGLSIPSNSVDRTRARARYRERMGLAGAGDWPENEPGKGKGLEAVSGGCPSRGWNEHQPAEWTGIGEQKGRRLKARPEFPSILSGGKFSCSLAHDFRASEYRGHGTAIKKCVAWQLDPGCFYNLVVIYASAG